MPVCIAGMHRSGTSMVANLLGSCGLYLGKDEEIIQARPDNPSGFWENLRFLSLNEELLSSIGSAWDIPPAKEKLSLLQKTNHPVVPKARALIAEFEGKEPWGWKDPRSSLTHGFWKRLLPKMHTVICVRNPLEVFQSLNRRGGSSVLFSMTLWMTYNAYLFVDTTPAERIVTHYDSYFAAPEQELKRVLGRLGIAVDGDLLEEATGKVELGLRHNRVTTQQLKDIGLSEAVITLYERICAEAGPVFKSIDG